MLCKKREMLCISRTSLHCKLALCALRRLTAPHPYAYASGLPSAGAPILATFKKKYFVQKQKKSPLSQGGHCREPESNWHVNCLTQDFKSWASTNSAIPASKNYYITIKIYFQVPNNNI